MISAIVTSVLPIVAKVLDISIMKMLTKHSENITNYEHKINAEKAKPLDQQDDILIPYLEDLLATEVRAFNRQLQLGMKASGSK